MFVVVYPVISNKDAICTRKFKYGTVETAAKTFSQSRKVIEHFSSFFIIVTHLLLRL